MSRIVDHFQRTLATRGAGAMAQGMLSDLPPSPAPAVLDRLRPDALPPPPFDFPEALELQARHRATLKSVREQENHLKEALEFRAAAEASLGRSDPMHEMTEQNETALIAGSVVVGGLSGFEDGKR